MRRKIEILEEEYEQQVVELHADIHSAGWIGLRIQTQLYSGTGGISSHHEPSFDIKKLGMDSLTFHTLGSFLQSVSNHSSILIFSSYVSLPICCRRAQFL